MTSLQNSRNPSHADYDFRKFASALRGRRMMDDRGMRAIADEIGVTLTDLSRAMGGQIVSVGKVIALCRWIGEPVDRFYLAPERAAESACFTGSNVKRGEVRP